MFQISLRVLSEPNPDELPNRTYFLQSRSRDLLKSKTKIITTAVEETNTFLKTEFLLFEHAGQLVFVNSGIHIAVENKRSLLNRKLQAKTVMKELLICGLHFDNLHCFLISSQSPSNTVKSSNAISPLLPIPTVPSITN